MKAAFDLTEEELRLISDIFHLEKEAIIEICNKTISGIGEILDKQYFAHTIRAMEEFVINSKKAVRSFFIRCVEDDAYVHPSYLLNPGPDGKIKNFYIHYSSSLSDKEKRMAIAHELGHLYINVTSRLDKSSDEQIKALEKIVNIIGLLFIFKRKAASLSDAFEGAANINIAKDYRDFCDQHEIKGVAVAV